MSTEAKFVQLKGRGYKEKLVHLLNICFTNELLRWILTVKSRSTYMYVDLKPLLQLIFYGEHYRYFSGHMTIQHSL